MSDNLKKCMKELEVAMRYRDKPTRNAKLKYLSNKICIYDALREIAMNIVNKNIPLNRKHINRLNQHTKTIKALKCGTKSKHLRKKLVLQSGGFLPWLLPLVATAITTAIDLVK